MIKIEEKYYKIWITLIKGIGIKKYINLINKFKTRKNIFNATKKELENIKLIDEKTVNNILNPQNKILAKKHLEYMEKHFIDIIAIEEEEYPSYLREIYNPPICIYIKGNKNIFRNKSIGIIGCRECTQYGKEIAQKFSYELARNKINIVSGLARGIDSFAHLGATYSKGLTTAVMGNGIDIVYPKENYYLVQKILNTNGAIISEYPIGTKPEKMNFPARNRIISGISNGLLVVEAKKKSGTLITVDFALEQGRDVFLIPRKHKFRKFRRYERFNKTRRKISNKLRRYFKRIIICKLHKKWKKVNNKSMKGILYK